MTDFLRGVRRHRGHTGKPHTHPHFHGDHTGGDIGEPESDHTHNHEHDHAYNHEHGHGHNCADERNPLHRPGQGQENSHSAETMGQENSHSAETMRLEVMEDILAENGRIADRVHECLHAKGIFCINIMGAPGAGKTTSLIRILENLKHLTPYVIEGDIESDIDTQTLRKLGVQTLQINTGGACHLDAPLIEKAISDMPLSERGILFIENIGNLVCPAEFKIGEDMKLLIATVTEGSDKPYKYPLAFEKADGILVNKVDLVPYLDFDEAFFMAGIRALNRTVPVFKVSGRSGEGFGEVVAWIESLAEQKTASH